jgi:hypothetical protein
LRRFIQHPAKHFIELTFVGLHVGDNSRFFVRDYSNADIPSVPTLGVFDASKID